MKLTQKLAISTALLLGISVASFVTMSGQTRAQNETPVAVAPVKEEGMAVVVNKTLAPTAELPTAEMLKAAPSEIARQLRKNGLQITANDTGSCIAITGQRVFAPEELKKGELADEVLAAALVGEVTKEQLARREKGYLRLENLSPLQRQIAEQMARRNGLLDKNGAPTEAGTQLMVGVYPQQVVYKVRRNKDKVSVDQFDIFIHPPTEAAVEAPKIRGSLLWWIWPHADATWGEDAVSLSPSTYSLKDLAAKLGEVTSWKIELDKQAPNTQLAVTAREMSLRKFLWTVAVASGLQVRVFPGAKVVFLTPHSDQQSEGQDASGQLGSLLQLPGSGYATSLNNDALQEVLESNEDFNSAHEDKTLGWKFSELPLLYREMLAEKSMGEQTGLNDRANASVEQNTSVFWVQGIHVSVGLFTQDLSGGGEAFFFPAL